MKQTALPNTGIHVLVQEQMTESHAKYLPAITLAEHWWQIST